MPQLPNELNYTPPTGREVRVGPDNADLTVDWRGVCIVGNGIKDDNITSALATAGGFGAAIAGDFATAKSSNGGASLAGDFSHAATGDSGVASAGNHSFAMSFQHSTAVSFDNGWSYSWGPGVAKTLRGVSETRGAGVALVVRPSDSAGICSIALAGPGGIALAATMGAVVCCGDGGAIAGYIGPEAAPTLIIERVGETSEYQPDRLYLLTPDGFVGLTAEQKKEAATFLKTCMQRWNPVHLKEVLARLAD